jgi:hypothetical protein
MNRTEPARDANADGGMAMMDRTTLRETHLTAGTGFAPWPVSWSGIWVGALTALAVSLVVGLVGVAVGAHQMIPRSVPGPREPGIWTFVFGVLGSFLAFAGGGWVGARVAGIYRAETAMLHGAIVWLLALSFLLAIGSMGAASFFGEWYGGLGGTTTWAMAPASSSVDPQAAAAAARNAAMSAVIAILLGLMGSVLGGWLGASGVPLAVADRELSRARA